LALTLWLKEPRRWLRWLGLAALVMVIVQGVLGGLRVVLLEGTLAIIHASFAQAFFAFMAALALFTSASWRAAAAEPPLADGGKLLRLGIITTALTYVQVIFGAVLRHSGERLEWHLVFAILVLLHIILLLARIARHPGEIPGAARLARLLGALLGAQLLLGAGSYFGKYTTLWRLSADAVVYITTVHLAVGALMLVASLLLTLRVWRSTRGAELVPARTMLREQPSL
jgi:cytochrome c oxidase assembly protein subunit 15